MFTEANNALIGYVWNHSSTICLIVDMDGIILQANAFAETLTGKKLKNNEIDNVFINFDNPAPIASYLLPPETKKLINIDTASKLPSSYYFHFYNLGTSVLAIGEANSIEAEIMGKTMLELNNELNNVTRELHKSNAELKKSNDQKNQFLGIAAHDLRNPIGFILMYSEYLLEQIADKISPAQLKMVDTIKSSCDFLLHLLDELLDISVIESGKLTLNLSKYNIKEQVKKNVELNNILAAKKNINISFNCTEQIPEILADIVKIEQVLNNLISNALKFSFPKTQIIVSIYLKDNYLIVAVTDQGQGIPKNEMDKVFKPFEKTSVRSTDKERSTGLGLAIVWNIIAGHGGKIWLESEVGRGTTFYFSLPIIKLNK